MKRHGVAAIAAMILGVSPVGFATTAAAAQGNSPARPVRMVVPFAVGGPTDLVARVAAQKLSEYLGQQFIVANRAGGNVGAGLVSNAPPDGDTLLMATVSTHATNPLPYKNIPFDPVTGFTPAGQVGIAPIALAVHPSIPAGNVKERGSDPTSRQAPEMLAAFAKAELAKWTPVAKAAGVQLD